ncbi:hypothetical protein JCM10207_001338 [Rhodosporidiobolus poonsookiae]
MSARLQQPPLWSQPLATRPRSLHLLRNAAFIALFDLAILTTFGLLVLLLTLRQLRPTRPLYLRLAKAAFGLTLVGVTEHFAPTEMVVSAGEGVNGEGWAERDDEGEIRRIRLPDNGVWMSNHSTLVDWLYLWTFSYLSGHHNSIYIALKASLRRIPIIGWAVELLNFIFLNRKWESDRVNFRHQLGRIARTTNDGGEGEKAAVLIFPEGTISTENTRGISSKYAAKAGVDEYKHTIIPRSTGLFFALRHLAASTPSLSLVDLTVGYPVPRQPPASSPSEKADPALLAADYYDIPSVLLSHVPPPELHIHLRAFPAASIPLGDLDRLATNPDDEGTPEERAKFDAWLAERWKEKDDLLERFKKEGSFIPAPPRRGGGSDDEDDEDDRRPGEYAWTPRLRYWWEPLAAFSFFVPVVVAALLWCYCGAIAAGCAAGVAALVQGLKGGGGGGAVVAEKTCGCGKMAAKKALQKGLEEL